MGSQLDIAGSFILAGMMILSFNMFIADKQNAELTSTNQVIRQQSMSSMTTLMMFDLRKAGYRVPTTPILNCNGSKLAFLGDVDNNGSIDTVAYEYKNGASKLSKIKRLLYRSYNGSTASSDLDILNFQFRYYDKNNAITTVAADVKSIRATIAFREKYRTTTDSTNIRNVDFRITPKNL